MFINVIFSNINKYVRCKEEFVTNQVITSFKMLFRGFVVKIQIENNEKNTDYTEYNRIVFTMYINFYY